jgi:hypothetical protein
MHLGVFGGRLVPVPFDGAFVNAALALGLVAMQAIFVALMVTLIVDIWRLWRIYKNFPAWVLTVCIVALLVGVIAVDCFLVPAWLRLFS